MTFRDALAAMPAQLDDMAQSMGRAKRSGLATADRTVVLFVLFLHYMQDNATELNLVFDRAHMSCNALASVASTAYFPNDELQQHVDDIARTCGFPRRPFRSMLQAFPQASLAAALRAFDFEEGTLIEQDGGDEVGNAINEAIRTIGSHFVRDPGGETLYAVSDAIARAALAEMKRMDRKSYSLCDFVCGRGGVPLMLFERRGNIHIDTIGLYDRADENVCHAAMRLFLAGFRGAYDLMAGNTLDRTFKPRRTFDVVLADCPVRTDSSLRTFKDQNDRGNIVDVSTDNAEALSIMTALGLLDPEGFILMHMSSYLSFSEGTLQSFRRHLVGQHCLETVVELTGKLKRRIDINPGESMIMKLRASGRAKGGVRLARIDLDSDDWSNGAVGRASLDDAFAAYVARTINEIDDWPGKIKLVDEHAIMEDASCSLRLANYDRTPIAQARDRVVSFQDALACWKNAEATEEATRLGVVRILGRAVEKTEPATKG